eukprot:TRINITY_DN74538_c0_g1_i1.p1 TRINITY_DN74538_c0_g1~~TRINITY_DN74538_c0_g1_i1.p1  ORF type:complete len:344 (+),score=59.96 TRINITY_DN74538_c0_g1_i1:69-1034(+)
MVDPTCHFYIPDLALEEEIMEKTPYNWRNETMFKELPGLTRALPVLSHSPPRWDPIGLLEDSPGLELGLQCPSKRNIEASHRQISEPEEEHDFSLPMKVDIDLGHLWQSPGVAEAIRMLQLKSHAADAQSERFQRRSTVKASLQYDNQFHKFFKRGKSEIFANDHRSFTKKEKGRLSVVSESRLHSRGVVHYLVQFTSGELSNADGVGLVFSSKIPVTSDLHKITSIFLNRTGRICKRTNEHVERIPIRLLQFEVGDVIEIVNNLDAQMVSFTIRPAHGGEPSFATVFYDVLGASPVLKDKNSSFLTVVVKNPFTTARLLS